MKLKKLKLKSASPLNDREMKNVLGGEGWGNYYAGNDGLYSCVDQRTGDHFFMGCHDAGWCHEVCRQNGRICVCHEFG